MAAAYLRIHQAISEQIRAGKLQPGDKLPSERDLAARFGVSLMTARHAVSMLQQEGSVIRRVGSGTFVAPATSGGQRLQDPHELCSSRLVGRLAALQLLAEGALLPQPMAGQACGVASRVWTAGAVRVIEEQIWIPAGNEKDLRKLGATPLLAWLTVDGLFARETIEAVVVHGSSMLRITHTLYDGSQRAVAHRVALCLGDRIRVQRIIQR
jgi:DNA-binding transcriptional regulator YhcF (GntR family)